MSEPPACKICDRRTERIGTKQGTLIDRQFEIVRCPGCAFAFVANPWTDFESIYSQQYYEGRGADPMVDYVFELRRPDVTIRNYEWNGLRKVIATLLGRQADIRWLDYGCGNGGLVRSASRVPGLDVWGFEEGWIAAEARRSGISVLDREGLETASAEGFDVITAIEVLEHVVDPLETLRDIRRRLRPGGLFFCTTGNAALHRNQLLNWPYIIPEIHISFFEPETLAYALEKTGFRPDYPGRVDGHTDIIRCRVLKHFYVRETAWWQDVLPWSMLAPIVDARVGFSKHPVGWAG